jgi:hypothetical protein
VDRSLARLYGRLCSPAAAAIGPERVSKDHKGLDTLCPATGRRGRWFEPAEVNMALGGLTVVGCLCWNNCTFDWKFVSAKCLIVLNFNV